MIDSAHVVGTVARIVMEGHRGTAGERLLFLLLSLLALLASGFFDLVRVLEVADCQDERQGVLQESPEA